MIQWSLTSTFFPLTYKKKWRGHIKSNIICSFQFRMGDFWVWCYSKRSDFPWRWESPPSTAIHTHSYEVSRGDDTEDESVRGAWLLVHASLLLNAGGRLSGPCNWTPTSSSGHPAVPQQCFHFCPLHNSNTGMATFRKQFSQRKILESIFCINMNCFSENN